MAKKSKRSKRRCEELPILHPDAAGIDVGASDLFVAVSADRDQHPVRSFPTFTRDLNALADWLQQCGIRSVVMESTSVYWIPVICLSCQKGIPWDITVLAAFSNTRIAERGHWASLTVCMSSRNHCLHVAIRLGPHKCIMVSG